MTWLPQSCLHFRAPSQSLSCFGWISPIARIDRTHLVFHTTKILLHAMASPNTVPPRPSVRLPAFLAAHFTIWQAAVISLPLYPYIFFSKPFGPDRTRSYVVNKTLGRRIGDPTPPGYSMFWAQLAMLNRCDHFCAIFEVLVRETLHGTYCLREIAKRILTVWRALRFGSNRPLAKMHSHNFLILLQSWHTIHPPWSFNPRNNLERWHYLDLRWHNGPIWQTAQPLLANDKGSLPYRAWGVLGFCDSIELDCNTMKL
jgi:hypothetical protein